MLIAVVNHLDERDVGQDKEKVKQKARGQFNKTPTTCNYRQSVFHK